MIEFNFQPVEVEYTYPTKKNREGVITKKYLRKKVITDEIINSMKEMLATGKNRKEVASYFKITQPTLRKYIGTVKSNIENK